MQVLAMPAAEHAPPQLCSEPIAGATAVSVSGVPSTKVPVTLVQPAPQLRPVGAELIAPAAVLVNISVRTGPIGIVSEPVSFPAFESVPPPVSAALAECCVELVPTPLTIAAWTT